jgi:hypothetical protein
LSRRDQALTIWSAAARRRFGPRRLDAALLRSDQDQNHLTRFDERNVFVKR